MTTTIVRYALLAIATFPFIYYLLALYSSWRFFRRPVTSAGPGLGNFTPPVSNLKPIRGIDPEAYENFASFCRQDYPDYELLFRVGEKDAPVVPVLEKLARDFPQSHIRILFGTASNAPNDKAAKLARLVSEARLPAHRGRTLGRSQGGSGHLPLCADRRENTGGKPPDDWHGFRFLCRDSGCPAT